MKKSKLVNKTPIVFGIMTIILIFSSGLVASGINQIDPIENELGLTTEEIKSLQDEFLAEQDLGNEEGLTAQGLEYFENYWSPGWWNRTLPADVQPKLFEIAEEELLKNWVSAPGYSYSEETSGDFNITKINTPQKSMTIRSSESGDTKTYSKTTITGQPEINVIAPDLSKLNDITVPIVPQSAGSGAAVPKEYVQIEELVTFGIDVTLADVDERYTKQIGILRFNAWTKVKLQFKLTFPVKLILEFPAQVIEGESYEFRCTLLPLDLPGDEFIIDIDIDIGANVEVYGLWGYSYRCRRTVWCWNHWRFERQWRTCHGLRWAWKPFGRSFVKKHFESASYMTPLSTGDKITITLPEIDLLELIGGKLASFMSQFVDIGLGFGDVDIFGKMVSGVMSLSPNVLNTRTVEWTKSNQTNKLDFTISPSAFLKTTSVQFLVSFLAIHFSKLVAHPYVFIRFKNFQTSFFGISFTIPCKDYFGEHTWYLPELPIPTPFLMIPYLDTISTSSSVIEDPTANYQFNMQVTKISRGNFEYSGNYDIYSPGYFSGNDEVYEIDISNPNLDAEQEDTILLEVSGLPLGYTANFDKASAEYSIIGSNLPSNQYFSSSNEFTATLTVKRPRNIAVPSGEWFFNITATSIQRRNMGDLTPSVTQSASLDIPEIIDYDLRMEDGLYQVLYPGLNALTLFGQNLGNLNDTIVVNATLEIYDDTFSWYNEFPIDPYGSGVDEYFSTSFDIDFSLNGMYPDPGLYILDIQTHSKRLPYISQAMTAILNFTTVHDVDASITPEATTVFANWETNFTLEVNNTGNVYDNFTISSSGWDDYLSFPTEITNLYSLGVEELIVTLSIPNPYIINPDVYTFRITIISDSNSAAFAIAETDVTILAPDDTPPAITSLDVHNPLIEPDLIYPQSPLTLGPSWEALDQYPSMYWIYINSSLYTSGIWDNETQIQSPVTGSNPLAVGAHNITIVFSDTSGNVASDEKWVEIRPTDTLPPSINPIQASLTFPLNHIDPQILSWEIEEEFVMDIALYRNDSFLPLDPRISLESIDNNASHFLVNYTNIPLSLSQGKWNFTLVIQDKSNNFADSTIWVDVVNPDSSVPVIADVPSSSGLLGRGESLTISATDQFPEHYEFLINSKSVNNKSWQSGVLISYEVDTLDLDVGDNNLEMVFYDLAGNTLNYPWTFTLLDIDPPALIEFPLDFTIFDHNFTVTDLPHWVIEDLDPQLGTYEIYKIWSSTELVESGVWVPGNASFTIPIIDPTPGVYTYEGRFYDASGNMYLIAVMVTVLDVIAPYVIPSPNIQYEPLFSPDWFEFIYLEKYPQSFTLYRNDTIVNEGDLISDFPIVFERFVDISTGVYNYTLVVEDESGNAGVGSLLVLISDYNPPLIKRPADITCSEGSTGNILLWEIREAYPYNYSIYRNDVLLESGTLATNELSLSLDGLGDGVYEYTLIVFDTNFQSYSCVSYVNVIDITPPTIQHIGDLVFEEGDETAAVVWQVADTNPNTYTITVNGSEVDTAKSWNGGEIIFQLAGYGLGAYEVELIVTDTAGNIARTTLWVRIVPKEEFKPASGFTLLSILGILVLSFGWRKRRRTKKMKK